MVNLTFSKVKQDLCRGHLSPAVLGRREMWEIFGRSFLLLFMKVILQPMGVKLHHVIPYPKVAK